MLRSLVFGLLAARLSSGQVVAPPPALGFSDTPKNLTMCSEDEFLAWGGGVPPYSLALLRGNQFLLTSAPLQDTVMHVNMTDYRKLFAPGQEFKFRVMDEEKHEINWSTILLPCPTSGGNSSVTTPPAPTRLSTTVEQPASTSSRIPSSSSSATPTTGSQSSPRTLPSQTSQGVSASASSTSNSKIAAGTIAGIAVGVVAGVLLILLLVWLLLRRRRRRQEPAPVANKSRPDLHDEEPHIQPYDPNTAAENSPELDPYSPPVPPPSTKRSSFQGSRASLTLHQPPASQMDAASEKGVLAASSPLASPRAATSAPSMAGWETMSGDSQRTPLPVHDTDVGPLDGPHPKPAAPLLPPMYNPDWLENRSSRE